MSSQAAEHMDADADFWWNATGEILDSMMRHAGYPLTYRHRTLQFYSDFIAPVLGPLPSKDASRKGLDSFMTDDGTPVEFSYNWRTADQHPMVRFSIEPLPPGTETIEPCARRSAMSRLISNVRPLCSTFDMTCFEFLAKRIVLQRTPEVPNESVDCLHNFGSQTFAAFDLTDTEVTFKAYFLPQLRATSERISSWNMVQTAVFEMIQGNEVMELAFDRFSRFYASFEKPLNLQTEIVGIDCVPAQESRVKIYVRSRATSFQSIRDVMTLGGLVKSSGMEEGLLSLRKLFHSVLGLDEDREDGLALKTVDHRTAGMLYYFEFRPGVDVPTSKLYIPVRHYAEHDLQIATRLGDFLGESKYLTMLKETFKHRNLETRLGLHTYVAAMVKGNELVVTSYFNPQVCAQNAP